MPNQHNNNNKAKRDRWASSSSDEEEDCKAKRQQDKKKSKKSQQNKPSSSSLSKKPHERAAAAAALHDNNNNSNNHVHNPLLHGCRLVYDTYEQVARLSEGTYGIVWKAKCLQTNETVALKQLKFDVYAGAAVEAGTTSFTTTHQTNKAKELGFPVMALREISVLLELSGHPSIVSVQEMVVGHKPDQVFMVMDYYEFDLKQGLQQFDGPLLQAELKGIFQQIIAGLAHMHDRWYLHRDLKTSNVLVHNTGRVALADFGLARQYTKPQTQPLTQLVCTLWYRAPELLLGETRYGPAVDVWSVGCVLGELICKDAVLQGQGELDQMDQIFGLVGVPTEDNWPGYSKLPNAGLFRWKTTTKPKLRDVFPVNAPHTNNTQAFLDQNGFDLLESLLRLDPAQRLTAAQALGHAYFSQGVQPKTPRFFSTTTTT